MTIYEPVGSSEDVGAVSQGNLTMNRMKRTFHILGLLSILAVPLIAQDGSPAKVKPEDVKVIADPEDVEFCKFVGEVKAKSGWGGSAGCGMGLESVNSTIRKRAADLGANEITNFEASCAFMTSGSAKAYSCSADDLQKAAAKLSDLRDAANRKIACTAGADCEFKWSRVTQWLQENSKWKFRNVTDTLITTEGPMETSDPAFEVIKMATGDGKTYQISMRPSCASRSNLPPWCGGTSHRSKSHSDLRRRDPPDTE